MKALLLLFLLAGCSGYYAFPEEIPSPGPSATRYEPPVALTTLELSRYCKLQISGECDYRTYLALQIRRHTIGAASTEWFTMAVFKDGVEIQRRKGEPNVAELPGADELWWNILTLTPKIEPPYQVIVVDQLNSQRYIFNVKGYGPAQQEP